LIYSLHGVSVQRACMLVQLQRASFHCQPRSAVDDEVVTEITAQAHPRYGYRRVWALLRRKRTINRKRVHRLWKRARLQVQRPKRRRQPVRVRCH
jgi:putative transposase